MKIFPAKTTSQPETTRTERPDGKVGGKISRNKAQLPPKKEMSAAEIKEKLAAHVGISDAAKTMAIKNTKKMGDAFLNTDVVKVEAPIVEAKVEAESEIKTPNTKDLTIKSDVELNDPTDTNTQEKLKSVLVKGAFNFNPKEKAALEKILG